MTLISGFGTMSSYQRPHDGLFERLVWCNIFLTVSSIYFILLTTIATSNGPSISSLFYIVININHYYILHSLVASQQKLYGHLWVTVNYVVVR